MEEGYDLSKMSLPAATKLAVALSGLSDDDIIARAGWSTGVGRRILNMSDNYWPSLPNVVKFCHAVGNTTLIDWLKEQTVCTISTIDAPITASELVLSMGELFESMGTLASDGGKAVADNQLDAKEARVLLRRVRNVMSQSARMLSQLEANVREEKNAKRIQLKKNKPQEDV